jgi:hypothetical protein
VLFAASFLLSALVQAQADPAAVRALASARYMSVDLEGALDLWNKVGEPKIREIHIHDADRTREAVVVRLAGLEKGQLLTRETFASRRTPSRRRASSAWARWPGRPSS